MTNITSLSQYLNSSTTQSGLSNSASSALADKTKSLLSQTAASTSETSADGDQITLSAAAKALLAQKTQKNYGFTLTDKQQKDLDTVIAKYKDKEVNQANYDAMQKDLKKLRLDTATMAARDNAKSFSLKGIMMSILNGKDVSNGVQQRAQASALKQDAYAKQIAADWAALKPASTTPTQ